MWSLVSPLLLLLQHSGVLAVPDPREGGYTSNANDGYPVALPVGTDRTAAPTAPKAADYADAADYVSALNFYTSLKTMNDAYKAEIARLMAYNAAVKAEMDKDKMARDAYFMETLGLVVPRATGRDDMLHPYVVTIAPKYPGGKADIVLKVGAFEDTSLPTANKYVPPTTEAGYDEGVHKLTIKVGKETFTALYLRHSAVDSACTVRVR